MSRTFASASSARVDWSPGGYHTTQVTLSAWVRFNTIPADGSYQAIYARSPTTGGDIRNLAFDIQGTAGGHLVRAVWTSGGPGSHVTYSGAVSLSTGQWYHFALTIDWTTNPDQVVIRVDDAPITVSLTTGTNDAAPDSSGTALASWGAHNSNATYSLFLDAELAEAGIWGAVLNAGELTSLARGMSPLLVRHASRLNYAPFLGGINDRAFGALTDSSTTAGTTHPKVLYPRSPLRIGEMPTTPPSSALLLKLQHYGAFV